MTDDLISKKALLKEIDEVIAQYNWKEYVILDILHCARDMVFDQPTAYDIDKVVEQLRVLYEMVRIDQKLAVSQAIEIVRKGGRNE